MKFGTDGVRGVAGQPPLDPTTISRLGAALVRLTQAAHPQAAPAADAKQAARDHSQPVHIAVGRDTRESGGWIEEALAKGVCAAGGRLTSFGVIPTPGVAYLTRTGAFDLGVVISASHNPFADNGLKVFSGLGEKFGEAEERAVEAIVADSSWTVADVPAVVDNLLCGSTHPQSLALAVVEKQCRLGVAFDGDGDRAIFVDHLGRIVDGDAVLLICGSRLKALNQLPGDTVVATVMSNLGLELAFQARGIRMIRTAVGDKYVMEEMLKNGYAIGGEQSGHVICAEHLFTGDGLGTALLVLRAMIESGRELSELAADLTTYPQVLLNVKVKERKDVNSIPSVASAIDRVTAAMAGKGRLLIRYSGTEPLLRIMIEGKDDATIKAWAEDIAAAVKAELA
jgi:phosphoglucosamine mutase